MLSIIWGPYSGLEYWEKILSILETRLDLDTLASTEKFCCIRGYTVLKISEGKKVLRTPEVTQVLGTIEVTLAEVGQTPSLTPAEISHWN